MPEIKKAVIKSTKTSVKFDEGGIISDVVSSYSTIWDKAFQIPDVPAYIQNRTGLTCSTVLRILIESGKLDDVLINPQLFLSNMKKSGMLNMKCGFSRIMKFMLTI
ncbi:MAG: hypothetical protein JRC91_05225 [Deltaproteobacteria bacterium]|nr:hypothetical protein [Deltaproteobacteria bacterium]